MRPLLQVRVFRLGDKYLVQLSGIPIGGPISGAALEAVLCVYEDAVDKIGWPAPCRKLKKQGTRPRWITIVRYVDDVFDIAQWFCPKCVSFVIISIYPAPFPLTQPMRVPGR